MPPIGKLVRRRSFAVHREGRLHRAISVQIADTRGRLLLQKRHIGKYHSGRTLDQHLLQSSPAPAKRRCKPHSGDWPAKWALFARSCPSSPQPIVANLDNEMIEHEVVHVFAGSYEGPIRADPREADGYAWVTPAALREDVTAKAERYSAWFGIYVRDYWQEVASLAEGREFEPRRS